MNVIERTQCAVTGSTDLEPLYSFKNFPVFMGCLNQPKSRDLKQDMSWCISKSSGLIQLKNLLPLEVLYPESHGAGAVGALWDMHHKAFAKFVNNIRPASVFEIGGAHGILEKQYQSFGTIPWVILEPNPSPVDGSKAKFIKGFFDEKFDYREHFDTVVHSHVFEHIYNPDDFMRHLSFFLAEGKRLVFSLPNMQIMLERKYTNCINFEHTILLTEPYIEYLLNKYGFRLEKKEYFMDDHSIFYACIKDSKVQASTLPQDLYEKNRNLYIQYISYHQKLISEINIKINRATGPIYLFGAHVFAQYLIEMGLNTKSIVSLLDNDINKHGKRLYGTDLRVLSPKILADLEAPVVILKAGVYNDEIKSDILNNINSSTIFLE